MGRKILTKAVLATIPEMVERSGMRADDIAEKLGCNLGTLKVRCSQAKISLRPPGSRRGRPRIDERTIRLSGDALALLQRAPPRAEKPKRRLRGTCWRRSREMTFTTRCWTMNRIVPMKKRAFG